MASWSLSGKQKPGAHYMKIYNVHPKYLSDDNVIAEHDFLHELYTSISGGKGGSVGTDHSDYFRYSGRRGVLYVRHRMLTEEMNVRAISHTTLIDRRVIEPDDMGYWEPSNDDVSEEKDELVAAGERGRYTLKSGDSAEEAAGRNDICSALVEVVDDEILLGLWARYRFTVMERSYSRYRALTDPLQGRKSGQVWILFDLMLEEAFSVEPDERGPKIAYESIWEILEESVTADEKTEFSQLMDKIESGQVSLDVRRFLGDLVSKYGVDELKKSQLLIPYLE